MGEFKFLLSGPACLLLLCDLTVGCSGWRWFSGPSDVILDHGDASQEEPASEVFLLMVLHSGELAQKE